LRFPACWECEEELSKCTATGGIWIRFHVILYGRGDLGAREQGQVLDFCTAVCNQRKSMCLFVF
jgi:hypothetical protein